MYFGGTGVEVIIIKRVIRDELFGDVENLGAFPVRAQAKLVLAYLADGFDRQVLFSLKSASNLNGNLNCSKELEHYAS